MANFFFLSLFLFPRAAKPRLLLVRSFFTMQLHPAPLCALLPGSCSQHLKAASMSGLTIGKTHAHTHTKCRGDGGKSRGAFVRLRCQDALGGGGVRFRRIGGEKGALLLERPAV